MLSTSFNENWAGITTAEGVAPRVYRVLLVEDEKLICRIIERILERHVQYDIHTVNTGADALEVFHTKGPFDVLLTDLGLFDVSGSQLVRKLVAKKPDLKVIIMTGGHPEGLDEFMILRKPFGPPELLLALDEAVTQLSACVTSQPST